MNKKVFIQSIFVSVFLFSHGLIAQDRIMHGIVTTFDSIPLNGANIKVQSSKQIVLSDSLGNFSVGCDKEDKLVVSANGFYTQKVKLTSYTKFAAINLKLKPGEKNREHALGFGHVADRDKLNAIASLNKNDIDFSQYRDMHELIGRFAGVQIVNGEVIIRGNSSINGTTPALIVVDGTPVNQSQLNSMSTSNVKSINIIKDGSSAFYGSRGANGVVVIETKQGGDN